MLVLSRDCNAAIRIGPDVKIKVLSIHKQRVRLGVDAPSDIRIWRDELPAEEPRPVAMEDRGGNGLREDAEAKFSVLVVEDDPDHARLICRVLFDCRCPQVTVAETGTAAIEALGGNGVPARTAAGPHLVLLDLNLPDMPGLDVLRRIRSNDRLQTMPVVVLSARRDDEVVMACLESGANAFVGKSGQLGEFRESVSRIATFFRSDCRLPRVRPQTQYIETYEPIVATP